GSSPVVSVSAPSVENAEMVCNAASAACLLVTRVKGVSLNSSAFAAKIRGALPPPACGKFHALDIVKNSRTNRVDKQFDFGWMLIMDAATRQQTQERREQLMARIKGGAAIFPAAPAAVRNHDVEHEYRQDTDLYYLTGFEEPNAVAVLVPDHPEHRFTLFVQPKDRDREVWTGWRAGEEGAKRDYGADAAFTIDKLDQELPKLLEKTDRLYYRFGSDPTFDEKLVGLMRRFQRERQRNGIGPTSVIDPADILHEMRLIKTDDELNLLRRAIEITCDGHIAA